LIEQLDAHPLRNAWRLSSAYRVALEATLEVPLNTEATASGDFDSESPSVRLLRASTDNLRNRAERLAPQLAAPVSRPPTPASPKARWFPPTMVGPFRVGASSFSPTRVTSPTSFNDWAAPPRLLRPAMPATGWSSIFVRYSHPKTPIWWRLSRKSRPLRDRSGCSDYADWPRSRA
jgi:hypothetical protein